VPYDGEGEVLIPRRDSEWLSDGQRIVMIFQRPSITARS
jgi:hypothetical protein